MKLGVLENVRDTIIRFQDLFQALGNQGSLTIAPTSSQFVKLKINDKAEVQFQTPATIHYQLQAGVLVITFDRPYPVVHYRGLTKDIDFVEITTERIDISIDWAPDGHFDVVS